MLHKKRVYIAGPYSKGDTMVNVRRAIAVGDEVACLGYAPFIPHLSHFWDRQVQHPYEFWTDWDNQFLACCDALLRIAGESAGSDAEEVLARALGIPVVYHVGDLSGLFSRAEA